MSDRHINIGILAPVDAGKTTLAEAMLFRTGTLRSAGRVDHQDAFLDTDQLEKQRGITIYSKMARFSAGDLCVTLVDTPGHADFSAEMERTLQVIDYAILIISGADGVRPQVRTLWRLLRDYEIPVFIFVNKMDQEQADKEKLTEEIRQELGSMVVDFTPFCEAAGQDAEEAGSSADGSGPCVLTDSSFVEEIALCDEALTERYLEGGTVTKEDVAGLVRDRKIVPCLFGSALKMTGVDELIRVLCHLVREPEYPENFGARIYKIMRAQDGTRLSFMKITGGTLKVRQVLRGFGRADVTDKENENAEGLEIPASSRAWEEKADQIRLYSGRNFESVQVAPAGTICAVAGLSRTYCGEGLGISAGDSLPVLEPVLDYALELPEGTDVHYFYRLLLTLEEEFPEIHAVWEEQTGEITVQVMGEVQTQVLKNVIRERYGTDVEFGLGRIVYRETIAAPSDGTGHFEPLRHYAEVHVRLEPSERGSGIEVETECSTDVLSLNWQRQILSALEDKRHRGVLTGSALTDVKIILTGGKASIKHTSGGDFRQAACRAVRQALMKAENVLLEPVYSYTLTLPVKNLGRAMTDIEKMSGTMGISRTSGEEAVLTGCAPVSEMRGYQTVLTSYTGGEGRIVCTPGGYAPCHNSEAVLGKIAYDPDADQCNPAGSVFCSGGAGFYVPWDKVEEYMHTETDSGYGESGSSGGLLSDYLKAPETGRETSDEYDDGRTGISAGGAAERRSGQMEGGVPGSNDLWRRREAEDKELMEIFHRTYNANRNEKKGWKKSTASADKIHRTRVYSGDKPKEEYLLVDGYNIIFAWKELSKIAGTSLEDARGRLLDILSNYQGYRKMTLIVVFDAYRVKGGEEQVLKYQNIYVVFTRERETADAYIQRTVHRISREKNVTVATSDGAEQAIIFGSGARRMAARELEEEVRNTCREISEKYLADHPGAHSYLFENIGDDLKKMLDEIKK